MNRSNRLYMACALCLLVAPVGIVHAADQAGAPNPLSPQRQSELEARQASMNATRRRLEARLRRVPQGIEAFRKELKRIYEKGQGRNATGFMFRGGDVANVVQNRMFGGEPSPVACLSQFSRQLAARGTDFILVTCPNQVQVHAHRLFDDIGPEHDVWPAYTRGLLELLDHDVEVIDLVDAFRDYDGDGDVVHPYDHHWGSDGMALAAQVLAKRLSCYGFVQEAADERRNFSTRTVTTPLPSELLAHNDIVPYGKWRVGYRLDWMPQDYKATQILYKGKVLNTHRRMRRRIHPVVIIGDSTVFHLSWQHGGTGAGFPEHLSRALGFPVAQRAKAAGGPKAALHYARELARKRPQPRVVILSMVMYDLVGTNWPVVELPAADAPAAEVAKGARRVRGIVRRTSAPPARNTPYKDALSVAAIEVTDVLDGSDDAFGGGEILAVRWVMHDAKLLRWSRLKQGQSVRLRLLPWKRAVERRPDLATARTVDDTGLFDAPMYWVLDYDLLPTAAPRHARPAD